MRKKPKTVLVADDNPTIRKALCFMFEAIEDYALCAEASDGREAIRLAIRYRPDIIILDLSMPVIDGLAAAAKLKQILPKTPIILFTQHAGAETKFSHIDLVVQKSEGAKLLDHIRALAP
jgi:CheY-like chemotaxis protein